MTTPTVAVCNHTPGPWGINKYGGIGAGQFFTAQLIIDSDGFAHDWYASERTRYTADMALICAAPELLEAAKVAAHRMALAIANKPCDLLGACSELLGAIAKAEGK